MNQSLPRIPKEYVVPLNMNGLRGRMLRLPVPKKSNRKREFLFIYGHHSSLERWYGMAEVLNDYGAVTMPDLPGFGGMDSFYKIGEKPDLDTMADYLAAFIKLRFRNKRLSIVGFSYGFLVVTRMLQKYPELHRKIDDTISLSGFSHYEDFTFSKRRMFVYRFLTKLMSFRLMSILFRNTALHPSVIRAVYGRTKNAKAKFTGLDDSALATSMEFEVRLWRTNDVRTHMFTNHEFLKVDNCKFRVGLPAWHVSVPKDRYFDNHKVEQHLRVIFDDLTVVKASTDNHSPSIIGTKKDASSYFPRKLKLRLAKPL